MKVHITVFGEPRPKQRPRFQRTRYGVKTFTPEETVEYENLVRWTYAQKYPHTKLEGQITAMIIAYFPIPESTPKKKRERMMFDDVPHSKRPDIDNVVKAVLDALNKIAYDDDGQVCELTARKFYSSYPRLELYLEEMEGDQK